MSKKRTFAFVILCGLVLIFPAIEVFRYIRTSANNDIGAMIVNSIKNTYLQGHYDAHQMFISVQRYVEKFGSTYGMQLIGALLFFVPRSLWPNKPVGTGHTVMTELQQHSFTNVSAPLVSEVYVNFGIIGIAIGAVLLGKLLKTVDDRYWAETNDLTAIKIVYPPVMFMFFFLLRGDMMSGWAYTCAQLVVGFVICKFAIKNQKDVLS